jgi:hypothetical protein
MELKDYLPLIGVAVGWSLNEAGTFAKRAIERKRIVGKAIALLYFLCLEMVQLKSVQESFKNMSSDVKEWERLRKRSFEKYTLNDPEFLKKLEATVDSIAEFYPLKAYELRELLAKYQFIKSKSLEVFTPAPEVYVAALSSYETGFLIYQHQLERLLRFLAYRHSKATWLRIRFHFWKLRRRVRKGDIVFYEQVNGRKKRQAQSTGPTTTSGQDIPKEGRNAGGSGGA